MQNWIGITIWLGVALAVGGVLMDLYLGFIPVSLLWATFIFSIIMAIHSAYPFLPFQYVGWRRKNRTLKFDIKEWQGRTKYRLEDVAALWVGLPPERPDDPTGRVNWHRGILESEIRFGHLECDDPKTSVVLR